MEENPNLIIEFLNLPQEYDYLMISPHRAKREVESEYLRSKVFEKKGNKCEICGKDSKINLHHKSYDINLPKTLRRLSTIGGSPKRFRTREDICKERNRAYRRKYLFYANEDHKWKLIERYYPFTFNEVIDNLEVLCTGCHYKKHIQSVKENGTFIPLSEKHLAELNNQPIPPKKDPEINTLPLQVRSENKDKPFNCLDCNRPINHRGRCLGCNIALKRKNTYIPE
jgi:hypothetical protein